MTLLVFFCGLVIGAVVAHFATKTPIVVNLVDRECKKCGDIDKSAGADSVPMLACPRCGVTGGRGGPFKSAHAVGGHMRACPKA